MNRMNSMACAKAMAAVVSDGEQLLEVHLSKWRLWHEQHPLDLQPLRGYPEYDSQVKLHLFAGDVFTPYLLKLLATGADAAPCLRLLEKMWQEGDEAVRNVLDVTILERLSDDEDAWQAMGRQVSPAFRDIINRVIMPNNGMFSGVKPLQG